MKLGSALKLVVDAATVKGSLSTLARSRDAPQLRLVPQRSGGTECQLTQPVQPPHPANDTGMDFYDAVVGCNPRTATTLQSGSRERLSWLPRLPPGCSPALLLQSLAEVNGPTMLTGAAMSAHTSLEATATTPWKNLGLVGDETLAVALNGLRNAMEPNWQSCDHHCAEQRVQQIQHWAPVATELASRDGGAGAGV
ncbi:hypothetical protein CGC21_36680 [Leishmania donovani]|uniref:Uncharacterized protein n=1 Tax=Leishmania donovani TaxID=5661 RepID=A0A504WY73_LEIDO|nr:hypothetical protein CGC21_36680 [Leishmania donovani]